MWVDLAYTGTANEAWTQDDVDLVGGTWREIADLTNIENLTGTRHAELLRGNGGANRLDSGAGNDTLTGRGGNDLFVFRTGFGQDRVTDFIGNGAAAGDVLEFSLGPAFDSLAEVMAAGSQVGSDVVFDFGGGNTLTLANNAPWEPAPERLLVRVARMSPGFQCHSRCNAHPAFGQGSSRAAGSVRPPRCA